jgi:hypothetical protein
VKSTEPYNIHEKVGTMVKADWSNNIILDVKTKFYNTLGIIEENKVINATLAQKF